MCWHSVTKTLFAKGAAGVIMWAVLAAVTVGGCDRKEKIIEVNTPGKQVEVERNKDTGAVNVEVKDK